MWELLFLLLSFQSNPPTPAPDLESKAQQIAQQYASEGYDRKAETTLREAIAVLQQSDPSRAQLLQLALAQRFASEQNFIAAASIVDQLLKSTPPPSNSIRRTALHQLAHIRDQMGEADSIEQLLIEAKSIPDSPPPHPGSFRLSSTSALRVYAGSLPGASDLAGFYLNRGETKKAEALYLQSIDQAKAPSELHAARQSYAYFLNSQQRFEESVAQWQLLIEAQSSSSRPEDQKAATFSRISLARTLLSANKPEAALELLAQNIPPPTSEPNARLAVLQQYGGILVQLKKFEEAEAVATQIRELASNSEAAKHADVMADQLLAQIRVAQNRPEEAQKLMAPYAAPPTSGPAPIWTQIQPVQELINRRKFDEAITRFKQVLAGAGPRIQSNPDEINALASVLNGLPPGRAEERLELTRAILATLDQVRPADSPRISTALGQFLNNAMSSGLTTAELKALIDKQERILVAVKGEQSMALVEVARQRARFFAFRGDQAEAISTLRLALKQSQSLAGPKSQITAQVIRELIDALEPDNENWPEEESLRLTLVEAPSMNRLNDLSALANRYYSLGNRDKALAWIDRAIAFARQNPQAVPMVQHLETQRVRFASQ